MDTENENRYKQSGFCFCPTCKTKISFHPPFKNEDEFESGLIRRLGRLSQVKAKPDFEQKMMALFALELDHEVSRINAAWLRKNKKIRLPDIISNPGSQIL